jgi:signal transduction histidine kinase
VATATDDDLIARLTRRLERERRARKAAERIAEDKTRELYQANLSLRDLNVSLEELVQARTRELAVARDAALDANQAKSDFLANMSHELRTPLNAIIGYSEMLIEDVAAMESEEVTEDLRKVLGAGRHLLALINDILDLSKIEAGKMELAIETVSVGGLVRVVVTTVQPLLAEKGNTLDVKVAEDVSAVAADELRLKQVLLNLMSNAAKFTEGGAIRLEVAAHEGDRIRFVVEDEGIGMSEAQLGRLFEVYTQAESTTSHRYGGTGLGLVISRRLCRLMGGDIEVQSELGEGSRFVVVLPREVST